MSQINLKIIRNPRKEKRLKDYLNKMKLKFKIRQINKLREKIKEIKSIIFNNNLFMKVFYNFLILTK